MTESPRHRRCKMSLFNACKKDPEFSNVELEKKMDFGRNGYFYICDVYAEYQGHKLDLEADGDVGHSGHIAHRKNVLRDKVFLEHGITTVRFLTQDLAGRKKMDEAKIMEEIIWKLEKGTNILSH